MIFNPDNPNLNQEVELFLLDNDIQPKNIPVTIIANPPILTVIDNPGKLSEILTELLAAYRTEGNYYLKLHSFPPGIAVVFGIGHTANSVSTKIGHC